MADDTSPSSPPATAPASKAKRGPGAPKANQNARTHGLHSKQQRAQRRRDGDWRAALAQAEAVIAAVSLKDDPLGERLARRLAEIDYESAMLEGFVDRRGRTNNDGTLKPAYERLLQMRSADLQECRRLIEKLAELKANTGAPAPARMVLHYGADTEPPKPCPHCGRFATKLDEEAAANGPYDESMPSDKVFSWDCTIGRAPYVNADGVRVEPADPAWGNDPPSAQLLDAPVAQPDSASPAPRGHAEADDTSAPPDAAPARAEAKPSPLRELLNRPVGTGSKRGESAYTPTGRKPPWEGNEALSPDGESPW
jgi:hypothetical protein